MIVQLMTTAEQLRRHPWVEDAQCRQADASAPGALVVFNRDGIDALCRHGRRGVVHALQRHLEDSGYMGTPLTFRLFDEMPSLTSAGQLDKLLQSPLPGDILPIDEREHDGTWHLSLRVPLDLVYFDGHFPQAPVLPGVVQVAWALSLAAPRLGTPPRCHRMEALKFQQLMRPGTRAELTLRHDSARDKLYFAYRGGDQAYSSGRLAWSAKA